MPTRIFRSEPTKLFLGSISVVPRPELRRSSEDGLVGTKLDDALLKVLVDIFALPPASGVLAPLENDMAVNIEVTSYSRGGLGVVSGSMEALPLLWRPKITMVGRIHAMQSGKTQAEFEVTEKMPWPEYLALALGWRSVLGLGGVTTRRQTQALFRNAALRLRSRVEASV